MTALAKVQLLPVAEAKPGTISTGTPTYEQTQCAGCLMTPMCKARGAAKAFRVEAVRGAPRYCKLLDIDLVACEAEHVPNLEDRPLARGAAHGRPSLGTKPLPKWLVDANVFINAERWQWKQCQQVLALGGVKIHLATTTPVLRELIYAFRLPAGLEEIPVGPLDAELLQLAEANAGVDKKAGTTDLGLVQVLLDRPDFRGILVEDADIVGIHPQSFIRKRTGREIETLTCAEFLRKYPAMQAPAKSAA